MSVSKSGIKVAHIILKGKIEKLDLHYVPGFE
jgi:hypothetical protein